MKQNDTPKEFLSGKKLKALDALINHDALISPVTPAEYRGPPCIDI
jgi:hypothetical protein